MAAPMAIVGMASAAGGAILGAYGNYMSGQASAAESNYRAQVALMNRQIAEQNANYARYAGEFQAQTSGMKTRERIAQTRAEQGASGLDVGSGSAARVVESEWKVGQTDMALIRSNAAKQAYGYEVEAEQDRAQSELDKFAAKQYKTAGTIAAIGSLLGGGASVASKWTAGSQAGLWS